MNTETTEIIGMAIEVIADKQKVLTSTNRQECEAYEDRANEMLSALNTVKKLMDDEAEIKQREYRVIKREARDIRDFMDELKSCKTRARDHKFNLQREL